MQETLTIKVRYLSDKIQPLEYIDGKSDWIDLRAAEDTELKAGDFKLIPLGIAMQLPKGYEAHIIPPQFHLQELRCYPGQPYGHGGRKLLR